MKRLFLFTICLLSFYKSSLSKSLDLNTPLITLNGKVIGGSGYSVHHCNLIIKPQGFDLIETITDMDGKFSTTVPAASMYSIIARALGFEAEEDVLSIRDMQPDSTLNVIISIFPLEEIKLSGMILDRKTGQPVKAEFDLYLNTDIVKKEVEVRDGKYEKTLTDYGWYLIDIFATGYLSTTDTLWIVTSGRPRLSKNYYLTAIEAGLTIRLKDIQFNSGKTTLHSDSYDELNSVANWLEKNPGLELEIGGHTDSEGPEGYNLSLSQGRAQAVVDYLVSQGVSSSQLVAKGYGETKPIKTGKTTEDKATNRRVELTVLKN